MTKEDLHTAPWLHLYGQHSFHGEAVIRGTREGLISLRDAIDTALTLKSGRARAPAYTSDGEGYEVVVDRVSALSSLGTPEYIWELEFELGRRELERARRNNRRK